MMRAVTTVFHSTLHCRQCVLQITDKCHQVIIIIVLFCVVAVVCIRADTVIGRWLLSSARK
jgi:hypothetical protein